MGAPMIHDPSIVTGNNAGLHNYEVVQLGNFSYEISCYASYDTGQNGPSIVPEPQPTSLEGCIGICSAMNIDAYGSCHAALFATNNICLVMSDVVTPEANINNVAESLSARLITSDYTFVHDALYILPLYNDNALGLCTTSNNRSYSFDTIAPEYYATQDAIYGPNVVRYNFLYENVCNRHFRGIEAGRQSQGQVASYAAALGPTYIHTPPVSNDDCAKLCNYMSVKQSTGQGDIAPDSGACLVWVFDPTDLGNECKLYNQTDGADLISPGVHGGRMIDNRIDPPYPSATNRPQVTGYVRNGLQYVSMTFQSVSSATSSIHLTTSST